MSDRPFIVQQHIDIGLSHALSVVSDNTTIEGLTFEDADELRKFNADLYALVQLINQGRVWVDHITEGLPSTTKGCIRILQEQGDPGRFRVCQVCADKNVTTVTQVIIENASTPAEVV